MAMLTSQPIAIRRAEPDEAELLSQIAYAAKQHWGYSAELMAIWRQSLTMTAQRIARDHVYVAMRDDVSVGFYSLMPTKVAQLIELDDLWVLPAMIGQGVGRSLFGHAASLTISLGGTALRLVADPHAIGFYQKMGMHKIGERPSQPVGRVLDLMEVAL